MAPWLAGCATAPAEMRRVRGTVLLRERVELERGTVVIVRLQDVSRMDIPAVVLAERRIEAGDQQPPFGFEFSIAPERIDPRLHYTVAARVEQGSRLLFINDEAYPVLTHGASDTVRLLLRRVYRP